MIMTENTLSSEMLRGSVIHLVNERAVSVPNMLKYVDISRSRLYDYLQGHGKVSATTLHNILLTMGVSPDELWLHAYLDNPELVKDAVAEEGQANKKIELNEVGIEMALRIWKKTHDSAYLVSLIENIYATEDDALKDQLYRRIGKAVGQFFSTLNFFTENDYKLFAYLIDFTDYEDVKLITSRMRNHIDRVIEIAKLNNDDAIQDRAYANYGIQYIAYSQFRFLMAAYRENDIQAVKEITWYLVDLPLPKLQWHQSFVKKIVQITQLAFTDDQEAARLLWNKVDDILNFMIPANDQLAYRAFLTCSYEEFISVVTCGRVKYA
jgi:hypothetical protein